MKKSVRYLFIVFLFICLTAGVSAQRLVDYVNPFIGTGGHGHTYPGASVPFGMVQLSPDNGTQGWDWCSGYHYSDSMIRGFSHTHLSGTGIGDLADISVMPAVGIEPGAPAFRSKFTHASEKAVPGYYAVELKDFSIWAELTATNRVGFHKYSFPESEKAMIRIDLGFAINWDKPVETYIEQVDETTYKGYRKSKGWAENQQVYFVVKLNKAIKKTVFAAEGKLVEGRSVKGRDAKADLVFSTGKGERVLMKVGVSMASMEGAMKSLNEAPGWDFENVRQQAAANWEQELRKVQIRTNDTKVKQIFYTALYHTMLAPVVFSDANGQYKGVKGDIMHAGTGTVYSVHSLWDTFRAANPLFTIMHAGIVKDLINSYLAFYDQYGLLPVWDLDFNETNTMTGYHAVPVIADAILKDISGFDIEKAYTAMKKSAMQNVRGTNFLREYKYVPQDKYGSSVTNTLEYAFDDWCIAAVAKKLHRKEDENYYLSRAGYYANLFDSSTGFFRGKNSDGKWVVPFDPYHSEHDADKAMYTEGTAWQHSFFVPHDVAGLIRLHGGKENFLKKLDSLFVVSSELKGGFVSPDISGLIGQYAHGNEPSHHIAYMYNYAGQPSKSADRVRYILEKMYTNLPDGLSGNEDCGQMSAWYVFSALGFYPVNPASGEYVIGSPIVDEAVISLRGSAVFHIKTSNNGPGNKYVQSVKLNGRPYTRNYFLHSELEKGGTLEIKMGSKPSKWGTGEKDQPSSMSR